MGEKHYALVGRDSEIMLVAASLHNPDHRHPPCPAGYALRPRVSTLLLRSLYHE